MWKDLITPAAQLEVVKRFTGNPDQLGFTLKHHIFDPKNPPRVALLGVPEGRGSAVTATGEGADAIRKQLYTLANFPNDLSIVDLGNIKQGVGVKDTHAALQLVAEELAERDIRLLVLGGSQDHTLSLLAGLARPEPDLVVVDDRLDKANDEERPFDERFLRYLPEGTILNLMAGQAYFMGNQLQEVDLEATGGEVITLGTLRAETEEIEPLLRKADLISFDYGALKMCEAPGQYRLSPNGLTGEEACQIGWYAGISTTPSWFALFGYAPSFDPDGSGAMMAAQISWYFIQGVAKRIDEEPLEEAQNFEHYTVVTEGLEDPITFLMHPRSQRWWMEVPSEDCTDYPVRIPCSARDYRMACENEISEKWWKYFHKS